MIEQFCDKSWNDVIMLDQQLSFLDWKHLDDTDKWKFSSRSTKNWWSFAHFVLWVVKIWCWWLQMRVLVDSRAYIKQRTCEVISVRQWIQVSKENGFKWTVEASLWAPDSRINRWSSERAWPDSSHQAVESDIWSTYSERLKSFKIQTDELPEQTRWRRQLRMGRRFLRRQGRHGDASSSWRLQIVFHLLGWNSLPRRMPSGIFVRLVARQLHVGWCSRLLPWVAWWCGARWRQMPSTRQRRVGVFALRILWRILHLHRRKSSSAFMPRRSTLERGREFLWWPKRRWLWRELNWKFQVYEEISVLPNRQLTLPPSLDLPNCDPGFVGQLPHPHNCNWFIHCDNTNRSVQLCRHLFYFDYFTRRCMFRDDATCIKHIGAGK